MGDNSKMAIPLEFTWLREELKKPGRSQTDLAKHMGLHVSAVNKILNGTRSLKLSEYRKILEYLGTDLRDGFNEFNRYNEDQIVASLSTPSAISILDADWVLMRSTAAPPGSSQSIERFLLDGLLNDSDSQLIWRCRLAIFDELKKAITLQMHSFTDRYASRLAGYLDEPQLAILLARGLAVLEEEDTQRLTSLVVASALANNQEGEGPKYDEALRRAAAALPSDSIDRIRTKLVKFTTDIIAKLVASQRSRVTAVENMLLAANGVRERVKANTLSRIERKSKNPIDG